MKYRLIRPVVREECHWLDDDLNAGEIVERYSGPTYGCITPRGIACCWGGKLPFFELPKDALEEVK
jgi:hypothetical protein